MAGYVSSALFGTVVASLVDKIGRKKGCLLFCILYGSHALLHLGPFLPRFHTTLHLKNERTVLQNYMFNTLRTHNHRKLFRLHSLCKGGERCGHFPPLFIL